MAVLEFTITRGENILPITFYNTIGSLLLSALLEVPESELLARIVAIGGQGIPDHIPLVENEHITLPINRIYPLLDSFRDKPFKGLDILIESNRYFLKTPQKQIGVIFTADDNT